MYMGVAATAHVYVYHRMLLETGGSSTATALHIASECMGEQGPGLGARLFALMGPQDAICVEVLLELLKIYLLLKPPPMPVEWAPHVLFAQLLRHISLDSSVLLDFLIDDTGPLILEYCIRCGRHCSTL